MKNIENDPRSTHVHGTLHRVEKENDYTKLIDYTPSNGTTFKDEDISRGEYQKFLYV